jgi:hypothetical protein
MFWVAPPPIIRSAYNSIYSIWYLSDRYCYPASNLVRQYDFPVPLRSRRTSDTVFVAFSARCRSLSDAFPHVVRTLANR